MYDATYIASASYVLGTPPPLPAMLYRAVRGDTKSRRPYSIKLRSTVTCGGVPHHSPVSLLRAVQYSRPPQFVILEVPQNPAPDNCHTSCRFPDLFVDSEQDVLPHGPWRTSFGVLRMGYVLMGGKSTAHKTPPSFTCYCDASIRTRIALL